MPKKGKSKPVEDTAEEEERQLFANLQARLRRLERDREMEQRQAKRETQRLEQEIERLAEEQRRLRTEEQDFEPAKVSKLRELMDQNLSLNHELKVEERAQQELGRQMSEWEEKTLDVKKREQKRSRLPDGSEAVHKLENKLHRAATQLSEQTTRNRELEEELQNLLGKRTFQQSQIEARGKELQQLKQQIKNITDNHIAACDAILQTHQNMEEMKEEFVNEREEFNAEVLRLRRTIMLQRDQTLFLQTKLKDREGRQDQGVAEEASAEDTETRADLEKMVDKLIQAQDEIFAVFQVVKTQNIEIATLNDEILMVKEEIEKEESGCRQRKRSHQDKMERLSGQLQGLEEQISQIERRSREKSRTLDQVKAGLTGVCRRIGCDGVQNFSSCFDALEIQVNAALGSQPPQT